MRRFTPPIFLVGLLVSTAGCIDVEQEYTINPDGSGKVVLRWVGAPLTLGSDKSADEKARDLLKGQVTQSEGVDAWKDISCTARDDGKFEFKGTAYFKDIARLKLHHGGATLADLKVAKDGRGNLVVGSDQSKAADPAKPAISDAEAKKQLKERRIEYQQGKRMMELLLADLKITTTVNLPGRIGECTQFKKAGPASVRAAFDGKAFLKAMDDLVMNDEWMLQNLRAHGTAENPALNDELLYEKLFGEKGPMRAVTTGELKPLFEYESEAGPARKAWTEAAARLGAVPTPPPPARGGDFKTLKIAGVRYILEKESDRGLNHEDPGLRITLIGDLPGTVLKTKEGRLRKAVADTGESLMPSGTEEIYSIQLSTDKSVVSFDVNLRLPPANVRGMKEVSGVLTYLVGGKIKEIDLGVGELKAGATVKDAKIDKIEDSPWEEGYQRLEITFAMSSDMIESVVMKDESGALLKTNAVGWRGSSRTVSLKGKFPARGRILVNVYEDLKEYEIPFKIENVDLLGRPLK